MSKKKSGGKPKSGLTTATTALMGLVFAAVMVVVAILAVIVALIGGATGCFGGSGEGAGSGGPEEVEAAHAVRPAEVAYLVEVLCNGVDHGPRPCS